jgi:nucleoside-diphosphate-sugar epimerase
MTSRRILITGASGCIGHDVTEALMRDSALELYLLVRDPRRLRLDTRARSGITVLPGDMREIARFADLLKTINVAVLTAAAWGGPEAYEINVTRTLELLSLLDPVVCQQVLYFSTASILDRRNRPLPEAGQLGTYYIRSKYECLRRLRELPVAPRTTVLFPTVVLGGADDRPRSFFSQDLPNMLKWIGLARFLSIDLSFHFIHARDVAQVVRHLVDHPGGGDGPRYLVLGQRRLTFDQAVAEVCAYLDRKIYFRLPIPLGWLSPVIPRLQTHMPVEDRAWGGFVVRYRHFTHEQLVNPATFGLPNYCPTVADVLRISGIRPGREAVEAPGHLG